MPAVTNAGERSLYPQAFRDALLAAGITGWSEYPTVGCWCGKLEGGVTFVLYLGERNLNRLGEIARSVATDQDVIQVVKVGRVVVGEA